MREPSREQQDAWLCLQQHAVLKVMEKHSANHAEDAVQIAMFSITTSGRMLIDDLGAMWLRASDGEIRRLERGYLVAASMNQLRKLLAREAANRRMLEQARTKASSKQSEETPAKSTRNPDWLTSPLSYVLTTELYGELRECFDRLSELHRRILLLKHINGRTRKDIATECLRTEGQIGNDERVAVAQLEACLETRLGMLWSAA